MPGNLRDSSDRMITRWVRGEPGELAPENRELLAEIERQIRDEQREQILADVGHWHPIDLAELFMESRFRRFPVMDENRLVGQVSRRDVLRALEDLAEA